LPSFKAPINLNDAADYRVNHRADYSRRLSPYRGQPGSERHLDPGHLRSDSAHGRGYLGRGDLGRTDLGRSGLGRSDWVCRDFDGRGNPESWVPVRTYLNPGCESWVPVRESWVPVRTYWQNSIDAQFVRLTLWYV